MNSALTLTLHLSEPKPVQISIRSRHQKPSPWRFSGQSPPQQIAQTPRSSTVIADLLSWPIKSHHIVFRTTLIELGFDFLIDESLIIFKTLLDMYFELNDIIQYLLDLSVQALHEVNWREASTVRTLMMVSATLRHMKCFE